jgi:hypothetical protein
MAQPTSPNDALLLLAVFSRYDEAIGWAKARAEGVWGAVALESDRFRFDDTDYYRPTMGAGLKKQFFAFGNRFDAGDMAEVKLLTNRWEEEYAREAKHDEPRPLNLDPGYLCLGKLVLASTKDHAHRIYLSQGIYAEATLHYRHKRWQPGGPGTFADYRREDYHEFFSQCRQYLHGIIHKEGAE